MAVVVALVAWLVGGCAFLVLAYRRTISAAWREGVLRAPVLVLESDDWGYGPLVQAERLDSLAALLARFRDASGNHPVATLGVVLAGPDAARMRADEGRRYHRETIGDGRLGVVRDAMLAGESRGVFALHLHGLEHYWPESLMIAARSQVPVRDWLLRNDYPATEDLPPALQSRWIDSTTLPSRPHPKGEVLAAAADEVRLFTALFGKAPDVAVPPTFVWDGIVEEAWVRAGVRTVVTPGRRCEGLGADAQPAMCASDIYNGEQPGNGVLYLVRNNYLEPMRGHTHERALADLQRNTHLGRPTLIEIHRSNFIGDEQAARAACDVVARTLEAACARFPAIRFLTTADLAEHYRSGGELIAAGLGARVHYLLRRLWARARLRKLAWVTGVALPAWVIYVATRPSAARGP